MVKALISPIYSSIVGQTEFFILSKFASLVEEYVLIPQTSTPHTNNFMSHFACGTGV